ncbi:hypothetical protein [Pseudomonas tremae]|uniref:hypothetical protein n=1 Tax=Pseudomonas tremae TaxID=200454 RepID=UPI001F28EA13|nr:hypothetical protein [Pseudomonas tremae]MCF5747750.1 hypothetical protein [Pseudomonas tremae]UQB35285.1 hypothetical protein I9H09_17135 [Pseudomonas tremae]
MTDSTDFKPYDRHDAVILGLSEVIKNLTAVVYAGSAQGHLLEESLLAALKVENPKAVPPEKIELYRSAISGALTAIETVKANSR